MLPRQGEDLLGQLRNLHERVFFLTGGSALGIFHLQHRISYDLDLFTLEQPDWHLLDNELRRLTQDLRIELQSVTTSPLFRRYSLRRGPETEIVDLVVEKVPQVEPDKLVFGDIRVDTARKKGDVGKWRTTLERFLIQEDVALYHARIRCDIAEQYMKDREYEKALPYAEKAAGTWAEWAMESAAEANE